MNLVGEVIAMAVAATLLTFVAISATGCTKTSEDVLIEAIENDFNAYKNFEDSALNEIAATAEEEGLSDLGISGIDFAKAVLDGFDYTIDYISVESDTAIVDVIVSSKSSTDFESKLSSRVQAFTESDESGTMTNEERNLKIGEITMQAFEDTKIVSEKVSLQFELQDKTWVSTNTSEALANLDSLVFAG